VGRIARSPVFAMGGALSSTKESEGRRDTAFKVVINHEEQYSIWPQDRDNPPGWSDVGVTGDKDHCLSYIEEVWTDMRPLSVRRAAEGEAADSDG